MSVPLFTAAVFVLLLVWNSCYLLLTTGIIYCLGWKISHTSAPAPMFGVYSQPGPLYYLKMVTFWLLLQLRRLSSDPDEARAADAGYGVKSRRSVEEMERTQPLGNHPLALDSAWLQGCNREGGWMVVGAARKPKNFLEAVLLVGIPGLGTLKLPRHPDSLLVAEEDAFGGEGLLVEPLEPMKKWKIKYSGKMKLQRSSSMLPRADGKTAAHPDYLQTNIDGSLSNNSEDEMVDVTIDFTYTSNLKFFDFDTDMSALTVARAMALETWSREFFARLQDAHQTHYEQIGTTAGNITVNNIVYPFSVKGMRDHTYAERRDWSLLHRYALHTIVMEDGTSAQVGVVSQPYNFSRIELGYVFTPEGECHALQWCDLQLGYHGENGVDPVDYGFSFCAGGKVYSVLVNVLDRQEIFQGKKWEARLIERPCRYEVNGVEGFGMSEWYYKHSGGRPKHAEVHVEVNDDDTEWVKVDQ